MMCLQNFNLLLGITGSVAAYKAAELARLLTQASAQVRVVMSAHSQQFITPLTLQALTHHPVCDDLFDPAQENAMGHIELARWADLIVVAPTSANTLAKLGQGRADNLLTSICLATQAPVAIVPAMNQAMWQHPLTQQALQNCRQAGYHIWGPAAGEQACGEVGEGRMLEPSTIFAHIQQTLAPKLLRDKKVFITAGPTQEAIDPIRYLTNKSSGKMGYALAEAAQRLGAEVTLISGPTALSVSSKIQRINVTTALEMQQAVMQFVPSQDIFISAAAVADYRVAKPSPQKIKKTQSTLTLEFIKNPDIVYEVGQLSPRPFMVGFAAESENLIANARDKLQRKHLDMIVANHLIEVAPFGSDHNQVTVFTHAGEQIDLPQQSKISLAFELLKLIAEEFTKVKNRCSVDESFI